MVKMLWSGRNSLQTLQMQAAEHLSCGLLEIGIGVSSRGFWSGEMSLLKLRIKAAEHLCLGQLRNKGRGIVKTLLEREDVTLETADEGSLELLL